jgi:hypothetical protein
MKRSFRLRLLTQGVAATLIIVLVADSAFAQAPGMGGDSGEGMPWQVAAMFTANWVLAAVAVAILSQYSKRTEKPKKSIEEEE